MSDNLEKIKRILLVVDGSQTSDQAAKFALRYAVSTECTLKAIFIIDTATMDYLLQMRIFVEDEKADFEQSLEYKGKSYLARLYEMAEKYNVEIDCQICRGRFHQIILQVAKENDVDMIVMGGWQRNSAHHNNFHTEHELLLEFADRPLVVVK